MRLLKCLSSPYAVARPHQGAMLTTHAKINITAAMIKIFRVERRFFGAIGCLFNAAESCRLRTDR